jgi:hypothetical protein
MQWCRAVRPVQQAGHKQERSIAIAAFSAGCSKPSMVPLWAFAATGLRLAVGSFLMQIMVQGAWGDIPVQLNELSPDDARGTFPGFTYQLGNLIGQRAAAGGYRRALRQRLRACTRCGCGRDRGRHCHPHRGWRRSQGVPSARPGSRQPPLPSALVGLGGTARKSPALVTAARA